MKHLKRILLLGVVFAAFSVPVFCQDQPEVPDFNKMIDDMMPTIIHELPTKAMRDRAKASWMRTQMADPNSELSKLLAKYQTGEPGGQGVSIGQGSGFGDEISSEIDKILGESGEQLMSGIKDELSGAITGLLSSVMGASPTGEVASLKNMVKEGLSQQQKIAYQDYKVDYAWQKAHTEFSHDFINYYNKLNLKEKFKTLGDYQAKAEGLINNRWMQPAERQYFAGMVKGIAGTEDLRADVKLVTNKGSKAVWMSESERITILNQTADEVAAKQTELRRINTQMAQLLMERMKRDSKWAELDYLDSKQRKQ